MARALLEKEERMHGVLEKIDFLVRFWELRARSEKLGEPLGPQEQVELLSLMQLVTTGHALPPGPVARDPGAIPAQVIGEGEVLAVEICNVTSHAILVTCASVFTAASQVIVRVADAVSGVELALPCAVDWVWRGSPCSMALVVDGIPTRTEFTSPMPLAGNALRIGVRHRLVG